MAGEKQKSVTVQLSEPVEHNGITHEQLVFRRCKTRDLVAMDKVSGDTRKTCAMYASMADVPLQVIEELDLDDFNEVAQQTAPLLGKSGKKALDDAAKKHAEKEKAASS